MIGQKDRTMTSYEIFLTKSREAAVLLASGLAAQKDNPNLCVGWGCAASADFVPTIYKGNDYFYAAAWCDSDVPAYKLVIC